MKLSEGEKKDAKKQKIKTSTTWRAKRSCRRRVRYLNDFASLPRCCCLNLNVFYSLHSATATPNIFRGAEIQKGFQGGVVLLKNRLRPVCQTETENPNQTKPNQKRNETKRKS